MSMWRIILGASIHLTVGLALVLLFSDPMVAVLGNLATKTHIPAFYVSFVVTPLASNSSEIVSAMIFAARKTQDKVSMSHASLYGAACMNNTFCLAIFFLIIYIHELPWNFAPETISVLVCEVALFVLGRSTTLFAWKGVVACALYPICLLIVIIWRLVGGH